MTIPKAYIEILGSFTKRRLELSPWDLRAIGEFRWVNVRSWLMRKAQEAESQAPLDLGEADLLGDFHAVCGDIDVLWVSEKSRWIYEGRRMTEETMKALQVRQDVYMVSGCYAQWGKVVEITPTVVKVQASELVGFSTTTGDQCYGLGTFECGPWEIDWKETLWRANRSAGGKGGTE